MTASDWPREGTKVVSIFSCNLLRRNVITVKSRALSAGPSYLADHAVPHVVDLFPVFSVGDQVEVVGELDVPGYLLQNINAEALAALLNVGASWCAVTATQTQKQWGQSFLPIRLWSELLHSCWLLHPHLVVSSKCKTRIMTVQRTHKCSWRGGRSL